MGPNLHDDALMGLWIYNTRPVLVGRECIQGPIAKHKRDVDGPEDGNCWNWSEFRLGSKMTKIRLKTPDMPDWNQLEQDDWKKLDTKRWAGKLHKRSGERFTVTDSSVVEKFHQTSIRDPIPNGPWYGHSEAASDETSDGPLQWTGTDLRFGVVGCIPY